MWDVGDWHPCVTPLPYVSLDHLMFDMDIKSTIHDDKQSTVSL